MELPDTKKRGHITSVIPAPNPLKNMNENKLNIIAITIGALISVLLIITLISLKDTNDEVTKIYNEFLME